MKRWKKIIVIVTALFILIPATISLADKKDDDIRTKPKIVKEGGVELASQRYGSGHYELLAYVKDSWNPFSAEQIDKGTLNIANTLFEFTKLLSSIIEDGIDKLYNVDVLSSVTDKVSTVSKELWENLKGNFGTILVTLAALQIFAYYVGQRNGSKAGRTALKLITVFIIATVWFGNSSYYLKAMNNLSSASQVQIMKAGTPFASTEIKEGEELDGSVAILRNTFFDLTVYKPMLLMNYGTTNEETITKKDKKRIENLVSLKATEEGYKEKNSIVQDEVEKLKNPSMTTTNTPYKIGMSFISIFFVIFLGVPIILVALFNFFIQAAIIGLSVFLPVACIVSLIPKLSNSAYKVFGNIIGLFCMKAFTGLVMLFIFLVTDITQTIFPLTSTSNYFLNVLTTAAGIILVIKYRDKILSFVTAGHVTTADGGASKQAYRTYKQKVHKPAVKAAKLTASFTTGIANNAGAFAVQKMKEARKNRTPQTAKTTTNTPKNGTSLDERRKAIRTKQEVASTKEAKEKSTSMNAVNIRKFQENRKVKRTPQHVASSSKANPSSDKRNEKERHSTTVRSVTSTPKFKEADHSQQETKQRASNLVRSQRLVAKEGHATRLNRTLQKSEPTETQTIKDSRPEQPIQHVSSQSYVEGNLQERRAAKRTVYQPPTNEREE